MIFNLIRLAIRGVAYASNPTTPNETYKRGLNRYSREYFDEHYPFQFRKTPLEDMPDDIEYYEANIGHITLMKKNDTKFFEIYETNIISEKELAMNVKLSYRDFEMTGITSRRNTVVTKNQKFVLFINDQLKQLEVKSSIQDDITDKMIKNDFGEYLFKYLKKGFSAPDTDSQ